MSCIHPDVVQNFGWDVQPALRYMRGPVLNADSTQNKHGMITSECRLLVRYGDHSEWMHMMVLNIDNSDIILGHNWLL